jgi:hypothetical protein
MKTFITSILLALTLTLAVHADCVTNAKSKTSYTVVANDTIILHGGFGPDIKVQFYGFVFQYSTVRVLKDHFCSFESAVIAIDGTPVDARKVTAIRR